MEPPRSLWWSTLDEPVVERPALKHSLDVDVAIVGGGYSGLWTARELKRRDPALCVAVLEQSVCGFGASGRNGGWASALYPVSDHVVRARHGDQALSHLHHQLRRGVTQLGVALADDGVNAHYVHGGSLTFARNPVQVTRLKEKVADAALSNVSSLRWLEKSELNECGQVEGALGAAFTPDCARVHPARLVRGLADVAETLGVAIFERTKVTRVVGRRGSRPALAVTTAGNVRATYVVRATEAFTPTFAGLRREVAPLYSLMIATQPQSRDFWAAHGFATSPTFADDRHLIIYGQRTADDRLAFGGRGAPYHFGSSIEPRFDESARVFAALETTLRDLFPDLEGEVTHRWGGPLAMTRDLSPSVIVDHTTGLASLGGYTGDGVVLSYVAANALADLLTQPETVTDATQLPFVGHRSRRWELEPARWLGARTGLALATWADRVEARHAKPSRASRGLERLLNDFPP